jgi:hypothetical protein
MKLRNFLILLCLPLLAFQCITQSYYMIKPVYPEKTIDAFSQEYEEITKIVDSWAIENKFQKNECTSVGTTPFCKRYILDRMRLITSLDVNTNHVNIDFSSSGTIDESIENSLLEKLKKNNKLALKR